MPDRAPRSLPLIVFVGFFAVHLLLVLGTFDAVDQEESEYGDVAVALLDGQPDDYASLWTDPSHGDGLMSGAGRRRRTLWSAEVLVTPVFAALGPSMLSLKLFTLLGGALWAAIWFGIARLAAPRAPPWLSAAMFVLPLPLVQRQALSATNLFAHLGSSLILGAALGLILLRVKRSPWAPTLLAGLLCGLGVYQSTSLAPMLLGPLYLAWRARGIGGALGFLGAMLPGLLLMIGFADPGSGGDLASRLTGLTAGDPMRGDPLPVALENARIALFYGAGFGRVDPQTLHLGFKPWGIAYSALSAAILLVGWPQRARPEPPVRALRTALLLSVLGYLLAWWHTGFRLETSYFDGLRYLLPIAGVLPVLLLVALQRHRRLRLPGGVAVLLLNALGFALLFRPSVFPAPWSHLVGYEPTVRRQWLQEPLRMEDVAPERRGRWRRFAGVSVGQQAGPEASFKQLRADPRALDDPEFWRGVGAGRLLALGPEDRATLPSGAPEPEAAWIAQGLAMGTAWRGCQQTIQAGLVSGLGAWTEDLWYGFGRADLACKLHFDEPLTDQQRAAWTRGLSDAWTRDFGRDGRVDLDFLRRLYIY